MSEFEPLNADERDELEAAPMFVHTYDAHRLVHLLLTARHANPWTTQDLLDIYDRTADRPSVREKIRNIVRRRA